MSDTTLWRPTGQAERDLVAQSGWRVWPPRLPEQPIFYPVLTRQYATRITREWNVPNGGVGYVTCFDVRRSFLERYEVHAAGGRDYQEYWIPAGDLDALNSNIVGAIQEVAEFRGPISSGELETAPPARPFPRAWREYLQRASWFRHGWLSDDCYLRLLRPAESMEVAAVWEPATTLHPGILLIGSDGASEHLAVDVRVEEPPVMAVNNVSAGWNGAVEQAKTIEAFIARVEDGSFVFRL